MRRKSVHRTLASLVVGALLAASVPALAQGTEDVENLLRELEFERNRLLLEGDVVGADPLHAPDFVLVNPFGAVINKNDFLGVLDQGRLEFLQIDVNHIQVRVYGNGAALRYLGRIQVRFEGEEVPPQDLWHLVTYELNDGEWQIVWAVASEVRPGPSPPPQAAAAVGAQLRSVSLDVAPPAPPRGPLFPELW